MKIHRNIIDNKQEILDRDKECVLCKVKSNLQIHEIKPRSAFGSKTIQMCFEPSNRVTLCVNCHMSAHTKSVRNLIKATMEIRYGYKY